MSQILSQMTPEDVHFFIVLAKTAIMGISILPFVLIGRLIRP